MPQGGIGLQPKVGASAPTLGSRSEVETTPMALWPPTQRVSNAPTLVRIIEPNNLNEVVVVCFDGGNGMAATALRLRMLVDGDPWVARAAQSWAS